ncbi:hypothetical protein C8J27_11147 [Rhodobacter aestuarii]|uniref:Uncharacterized protein n=1 Tax=Rhodobacter aestuarii TaxID=453582 RepID=A0A1N7Q5T4_9RHOB|nr:hypothetical protein [Rhodobacter aestuarii]PTV93880.1 hypothetical protein C8J27_11147 [Rhodobacter aestuarii]SIT18079.1 hypothetical protein SAMN05421580_11330 [Rhodobacter aestuarii]
MDLPHLSGLTPPNLSTTPQVSAPAPANAARAEAFENLVTAPSGAEMEALFRAFSASEGGEAVAAVEEAPTTAPQSAPVSAPSMAESLFAAFHGAAQPASEVGSDAVGALRLQALLGEMR